MSVKLKITGLEQATQRLKTQVGRAIKTSGFEKTITNDSVEEIRKNGVSPGLKASTVKNRIRYEQTNTTHKDYSPNKSNLTYTGKLLNNLRVTFNVRRLSFLFRANGVHPKLKTLSGRATKGKSVRNQDLLGYVNEQRPILQIFTRQGFKKRIVEKLKTAIRQNFK